MKYVLLFALFLQGCVSATVISKQYEPDKQIVLAYLDSGADFVINSRREDAIKKAADFCGSEAKIIREGLQSDVAGIYNGQLNSSANVSVPMVQNHNYMLFKCN